MHETIIVIFIFLVILAVGMIFFYKYQLGSIEADQVKYKQQQFENVLLAVPSFPEIRCSLYGVSENCIDVSKVLAFNLVLQKNKDYYNTQYGMKNITIFSVYPLKNSVECTLSNDNCGIWNVFNNKPLARKDFLRLESPVSLYNPKDESYSIGLMVVEEYNV